MDMWQVVRLIALQTPRTVETHRRRRINRADRREVPRRPRGLWREARGAVSEHTVIGRSRRGVRTLRSTVRRSQRRELRRHVRRVDLEELQGLRQTAETPFADAL